MRIGIDCRDIMHASGGHAGIGHYVHHLVESLLAEDRENDYVLFFDNKDAATARRSLHLGRKNVHIRTLPFSAFKKYLPFVHRHIVVSAAFMKERLDVLHGPAGTVPLFYRRPWVVTIHDLAIYDHPEWFPAGTLGTQAFSTSLLVPHAIEHARRIIAVSETTKNDILRHFTPDPAKIDVIYEGATLCHPTQTPCHSGQAQRDPESTFLSAHSLKPGSFALFLGTLEPRKNIPLAIRAFVRAVETMRLPHGATFAIAGKVGWKEGPTFSAIRDAERRLTGTGASVRYVGYLDHDGKHALLAAARVFLFPTLYEGFGLPLVEAMASGTPVVATDTGSVREVCADAALIVPSDDVEGFAEALVSAWADDAVRSRLIADGKRRAADFSWTESARRTLHTYRDAVDARVSLHDHDVA